MAQVLVNIKDESHLSTTLHLNTKNAHSDIPSSRGKSGAVHCPKCNSWFLKNAKMAAGGPGSGRKHETGKIQQLDDYNDLRLAVRTAARYGTARDVAVAKQKLANAQKSIK